MYGAPYGPAAASGGGAGPAGYVPPGYGQSFPPPPGAAPAPPPPPHHHHHPGMGPGPPGPPHHLHHPAAMMHGPPGTPHHHHHHQCNSHAGLHLHAPVAGKCAAAIDQFLINCLITQTQRIGFCVRVRFLYSLLIVIFRVLNYFASVSDAQYCNHLNFVKSVILCLFVGWLTYLENHKSKVHKIFCTLITCGHGVLL